ncbi:MAG: hypothetical protein PGN09_01595 [Sphingomonas fennica]
MDPAAARRNGAFRSSGTAKKIVHLAGDPFRGMVRARSRDIDPQPLVAMIQKDRTIRFGRKNGGVDRLPKSTARRVQEAAGTLIGVADDMHADEKATPPVGELADRLLPFPAPIGIPSPRHRKDDRHRRRHGDSLVEGQITDRAHHPVEGRRPEVGDREGGIEDRVVVDQTAVQPLGQ